MRWSTEYRRSGSRTGGSLFPFLLLILAPVIVVILTALFLGYALWRLGFLLWQLLCLAWQAIRARRVPGTSGRATSYS
jgi:hypothetical protein